MSSSPDPPPGPRRKRRSGRRLVVVLFGLVVGSLLLVRPAAAHAELIGSDPASGAVLARAPDVATLRFSEEISPEFSSIRLVDRGGRPVPGAGATRASAAARALTVRLPSLAAGSYGLVWRVLAEDDGHTTGGVVVFSVGRPSGGAAAEPESFASGVAGTAARPDAVIARWLRLCLLAGLVGALAVAGPVLGRARARARAGNSEGESGGARAGTLADGIDAARLRLLGLAAACAVVGAVVGANDVARGPGPIGHVLAATRWGHLWLARTVILCALAGCVVALRRGVARAGPAGAPSSRGFAWSPVLPWFGAAALVAAAAVVEALGGHAPAALGAARALAVAAAAVHILTAWLWLGAVAALVVVAWPEPGRAAAGVRLRLDLLRACRRPFMRLAVLSFGLVVATGLYNTAGQVESTDALVTTAYGRTLLVKIAILVVVVGLGLRNATDAHPRRTMRRIGAEAGAGVLLLLAVGVLAETAPGRSAATAEPSAATAEPSAGQTPIGTGAAADLVVSASVTPNRPGTNGFTVLVASTRRPAPAPITGVTLRSANGTMYLRQLEPGRYFGTADLRAAGPNRLTIAIERAGRRFAVPVTWAVPSPPAQVVPAGSRPTATSGIRLAPVLIPAAWATFGVVVVIGVGWQAILRAIVLTVRRRRPTAGVPLATTEAATTEAATTEAATKDAVMEEPERV